MTRPTLTRADQVLKAVRKGARIETAGELGLLSLLDRNGREVPAWQSAINEARLHLQERAK